MSAIEIPSVLGFRARQFDLAHQQSITATTGGFSQVLDRAYPVWAAEYTTPPMRPAVYNQFIAWKYKLRGAANTFLAYDPARVMPYAYRHLSIAADPWTAIGQTAPRITAQSFVNSTINLDRLIAGAQITMGDYISAFDGVAWHLFRVMADAVAGGGGTVSGLLVAPRPILAAVSINVRYRKACAEMRAIKIQDSGEVDRPDIAQITAVQLIRRAV